MRRLALIGVLAAVAIAGCGNPSGDVWAVQRSGQGPGAALTVIIHDDGTVTCNGKLYQLPGQLLIEARDILGDLQDAAAIHEHLPPGPDPVLRYVVATPSGSTSFWDDSAHKRSSFNDVADMTLLIATKTCGLSR